MVCVILFTFNVKFIIWVETVVGLLVFFLIVSHNSSSSGLPMHNLFMNLLQWVFYSLCDFIIDVHLCLSFSFSLYLLCIPLLPVKSLMVYSGSDLSSLTIQIITKFTKYFVTSFKTVDGLSYCETMVLTRAKNTVTELIFCFYPTAKTV